MNLTTADEALQPYILHIASGYDPAFEKQLFAKSCEPDIRKFTPKDASERFRDEATFEKWRSGGREMHWLLGPGNDLAGIIWYGRRALPVKTIELSEVPQETMAIRLYSGYTGKGLARPAMLQSLRMHVAAKKQHGEAVEGIWLQTDITNAAAVAVYTKFGYHEVYRDEARITMIMTREEIIAKCADTV